MPTVLRPRRVWPRQVRGRAGTGWIPPIVDSRDFTIDSPKIAPIVRRIKRFVALGVPAMFGFWGYGSFDSGEEPGSVPLPTRAELEGDPQWGHAVVAVGYDDARKVTNTVDNQSTKGALLIRNSWGTEWGQAGYGWMPYEYVLRSIALDFWSLLEMEYVDTSEFYLDL